MPSTATTRLRLEKQALGENSATWGAPKLNDVFDRLDEAIGGVEALSISGGTTTLTSTNYSTDQARKAVLVLSGTLASAATVVVPAVEKVYLCINNTVMGSYSVTIKTASGAGVSLPAGPYLVYCNGTSVFSGTPRLDGLGTAGGTLNMGGYRVTNSATPTATTDLATKAYVDAAVVGGDNTAAIAALQASIDSSIATLAPKASPTFTSGATVSTGVMTVPLGTVSSPSYTFSGDTNTGIFSSGADSVSLVAGGTARATASSSGLGVTGALTTTGAASIGSTLGVTGAATFGSTLGVTGATTLSGTLSASGNIQALAGVTVSGAPVLTAAGTAASPSHSFSGDPDTGVYSSGTNILGIATGGAVRMQVDASGNVWSNMTPGSISSDTRAYVMKGPNSGGGYGAIVVEDGLNTKQGVFQISGSSGDVDVGTQSTNTTGRLGFLAGGSLRQTITANGTVLINQVSTGTPGYSTDGSVLGISLGLFGTSGRVFVSQDAFSQWNMTSDGSLLVFSRSGTSVGSIGVTTTATSYGTSSDYRLKENVEPLTGALDRLAALKPSRFNFKVLPGQRFDGFLAHEVSPVVPEAVIGAKDGETMQGVDLSKLVPLLTAGIQELLARVEALEGQG